MSERTFPPFRFHNLVQRLAEDKYFPLKLFLLALLVRALFTLVHLKVYLVSDMIGYNEGAVSLLQDGQFRVKGVITASRPPLYPYFMMAIYFLLGHSFLAVRLVQGIIDALSALLVMKIGEEMFDRRSGALAGLAYALYPAAWAMSDMLLSETLFTFLMLISLRFMVRIPDMRSPWVIFWAGLFTGAAALTRFAFVPFPLFILAGVILLRFRHPQIISRYALMVAIFLLALLPWMLRNYYTHGLFTLNLKSGSDFYMYNHSGLKYIILNYEDIKEREQTQTWDEAKKNREGIRRGLQWIMTHPHLFLLKGVRMIMNIWGFDRDYLWWYFAGYFGQDPRWLVGIFIILTGLPFIVIAPLAMAGFWVSKPLSGNRLPAALIIVCLHIVTFVLYGFSRHRFPYTPLLIIWAGFALMNWEQVRATLTKGNRSWRKTAIVFSWCVLLFSWVVEIIVDAGSLIGLRFVYPGY